MTFVGDDLIARAAALPVANIGDAMERLGVMDSAIKPVFLTARLAGRAFTILTAGGDNKAIHDHLAETRPGDVLVIDGQRNTERALLGELIAGRAVSTGVVGMVVDGAIRDAEELEAMNFPVFARAITPAGPYRHGPGRASEPIACGGVVVTPGDLIVGDRDGVVVVPAGRAAEVIDAAEAKHREETRQRAETVDARPLKAKTITLTILLTKLYGHAMDTGNVVAVLEVAA